jgi:type III pantothenate kinase
MTRWLLIDVGNSATKMVWRTENTIVHTRDIPTAETMRLAAAAWESGPEFDRAVIASVVPVVTPFWKSLLGDRLLVFRHDLHLGIGIDYPEPASIGADRLANAIAAENRHGAPVVVIDFGTAVTFDIVGPGSTYLGGVIAPGLGVFTDYLHERTALLPRIELTEPQSVIGTSTTEAMRAGAVIGYRGLITGLIQSITAEIMTRHPESKPPAVIATGGHARLIANGLPLIQSVNPDLTIHGLQLIGERNPD